MINTILFITVIILLFVLLALLVVIVMEYRSKRSYNHYMMEEWNDGPSSDGGTSPAADRSVQKERSIPYPPEEDPDPKEEGTEWIPVGDDRANGDPPHDPPFMQYPSREEIGKDENPRVEAIRQKSYGPFSHQRLVETMGLSPEEADEFVLELIHQLEEAIPLIDRSIEDGKFEEIEHITHGLKGAATNIGSGGVADILVDYNSEMKECKDIDVAKSYQDLLRGAVSDLKIEYSQVA